MTVNATTAGAPELRPYEPTSESWSGREHDLNGTMVIILKDGTHYLPDEQAALVNPEQYTIVCVHPDTCPIHGPPYSEFSHIWTPMGRGHHTE